MSIASLIENAEVSSACCGPDMTVLEAAERIAALDVNALAVVDDNNVLRGIITDHDVIRAVVKSNCQIHKHAVSEYMSTPVITCEQGAHLSHAIDLMSRHRIRHIVVVADGAPVGPLSIKDILSKVHEDDALEINVLRDLALPTVAART